MLCPWQSIAKHSKARNISFLEDKRSSGLLHMGLGVGLFDDMGLRLGFDAAQDFDYHSFLLVYIESVQAYISLL